jgi:hypothetical protein
MAERPFQPVPNTPLVADPTGDAIWKRWLQGLQSFLGRAVRGPGSSTDNAVARWDGTSGQFLNNSGVIIDDSNNVSGIVNLTTTGSTILGDAAADTLTINAGTWTIGSNYTATRAAGVLPSGTTNIISQNITYSGDLGGTSDGRGFVNTSSVFGSNPLILAISHRNILISNSTATITSGYAETSLISVESSGNITNAQGFRSSVNLQSSGSVSVFDGFTAPAPVLSSTGTITTINAFRAQNLGNSLVTTAVGFKVDNFTNSTNMRGVQSSLSSGAGKHNLYIDGTANNSLAGPLYLAQDTKAIQTASAMYAGTGAPNNANGSDGDFYMRGDGGVLTTIYQRRAGAWVGVV